VSNRFTVLNDIGLVVNAAFFLINIIQFVRLNKYLDRADFELQKARKLQDKLEKEN
jgi:hypothetical protein